MMQSVKLSNKPKPRILASEWKFEAIGTQWWIRIDEPVSTSKFQSLQHLISKRVEAFDRTYSRFRSDSLITRMSKTAGEYRLPADSRPMVEFYRSLYDLTEGAFTPLIGDVLVQAGYDASYSLRPGELHAPLSWDEIISYEANTMTIKHPATLDFGAAGKGYLVDIVADLLKGKGIEQFTVDASGDMVTNGQKTLKIGLEHPDSPEKIIGTAKLSDNAIAGSAINRRVWADYHHIFDPFKLTPTSGIKAIWVVADTAMVADGLTTALFFVGPEKLKQFEFEYLIINDVNQYKMSPNFPAELY